MGRHRSQYAGRVLCLNLHQSRRCGRACCGRKWAKYSSVPSSHIFQPLVLETLGPNNTTGVSFLFELGRRLTSVWGLEGPTVIWKPHNYWGKGGRWGNGERKERRNLVQRSFQTRTATRSCRTRKRAVISVSSIYCDNVDMLAHL